MAEEPLGSIRIHFSKLEDPRIDRQKLHPLMDIIVIAICAVICGAETWVDIENFGKARLEWFKKFLELPNGVPSHDTFGRVFGLLKAEAFEACFFDWVQAVNQVTRGQVIAIDGKEVRHSFDTFVGKKAIHLVSAWASENRIVLAQRKVDSKTNEITVIPELLDALEVAGCIVTLDAMGCQKEIARKIIERKADYILTVKDNQGYLHEDMAHLFGLYLKEPNPLQYVEAYAKTVDKDHGRIEIRECWTLAVAPHQDAIRNVGDWERLTSLVCIRRERRLADRTQVEMQYYITSLAPNADRLLQAIRDHWGIENSVHWVLDVAFNEDRSRVRKDHAPENLAVIRRIALNLLRKERSAKGGLQAKRLQCGWDENYFFKVLSI
ncbi:MAG: ISAs1 family transposase [Longilinea sp.]|nr:ISAs1 family transposase [Longilinea sp.]